MILPSISTLIKLIFPTRFRVMFCISDMNCVCGFSDLIFHSKHDVEIVFEISRWQHPISCGSMQFKALMEINLTFIATCPPLGWSFVQWEIVIKPRFYKQSFFNIKFINMYYVLVDYGNELLYFNIHIEYV